MDANFLKVVAAEIAEVEGISIAAAERLVHALHTKIDGDPEAFRHAARVAASRGMTASDAKRLSRVKVADLLGVRRESGAAPQAPAAQAPAPAVTIDAPEERATPTAPSMPRPGSAAAVPKAKRAPSAPKPKIIPVTAGALLPPGARVWGVDFEYEKGKWRPFTGAIGYYDNGYTIPPGFRAMVEMYPRAKDWAVPTPGASAWGEERHVDPASAMLSAAASTNGDGAAVAGPDRETGVNSDRVDVQPGEAAAEREVAADPAPLPDDKMPNDYYPGKRIAVPAARIVLGGPKGQITMVNRLPVVSMPHQGLRMQRRGIALVGGNKGLTRGVIHDFGAYRRNGGLTKAYGMEPSSDSGTESD